MMSRTRHHPPAHGFGNDVDGTYWSPAGGLRSDRLRKTGDARLADAASVRMPITLCRAGVERLPPFHHMSYVDPVATPVNPSRVRSSTARVPTRLMAATIAGSRFGLSGSRYGGTNKRSPSP